MGQLTFGKYGVESIVRIIHPCVRAAGQDLSVDEVGAIVVHVGLDGANPQELLRGVIAAGPRRKVHSVSEESEGISWRLFGEVALGVLGWQPEQFWNATPQEFWMAYDGWCAANIPKEKFVVEDSYTEEELAFIEREKAKDGPIDKSKRRPLKPETIRKFMSEKFGKDSEVRRGK